jgi:Fungal hydrophobin
MKFTILALVPVALALPAIDLDKRQANVCAGTTGTAQCCATDVLGVADLNCANRT